MALLQSHSDTNLVIEEALSVRYAKHVIEGSWQQTSSMGITIASYGRMYEMHRYARKRFTYVGMTYEAAVACRDKMTEIFTRIQKGPQWWDSFSGRWQEDDSHAMLSICTADITVSHEVADAWNVHVDVNEDDIRMVMTNHSGTAKSAFPEDITTRTYGSDAHGVDEEQEPEADEQEPEADEQDPETEQST